MNSLSACLCVCLSICLLSLIYLFFFSSISCCGPINFARTNINLFVLYTHKTTLWLKKKKNDSRINAVYIGHLVVRVGSWLGVVFIKCCDFQRLSFARSITELCVLATKVAYDFKFSYVVCCLYVKYLLPP